MSSIKQDMSQNSHSISNITDAIRTHIRRESLTSFGRRSFASGADLQLKNAHFESVSAAVVHLFQGKPLGENDLAALQESVREVLKTDAGPLVFDFYKDKLVKKGMVILREKIKHETGAALLSALGEQWDFFYCEILPVVQSLLYPIKTQDLTIRQITLLEFRNTVLLKVPFKAALQNAISNEETVSASNRQMLLILQSVQDTPITENYFRLESLVATVVSPYLGLLGYYNGGNEPEIRSNFKVPSRIQNIPVIFTTCESDSDDDISDRSDVTPGSKGHKHLSPLLSGVSHRPLGKRTSGLLPNPLLASVKEQDRGTIRRYSIATS
ncbi:proline-rich protein 5-like isoform X2 [Mya arenaria]|uniref:proline-rich protein 5-like isoform X2 n=1 Tax=Mya arenaria TaxID=6604 RepID=UPI0022E0E8B3|nr:proline-rich protein 5-like isoform X2 [Mya arenaria]